MAAKKTVTVTGIELDPETRKALEDLDAKATRRERIAALRAEIAKTPCDVCGKLGHREEAHIRRA